MTTFRIALITVPTVEEARKLAQGIVSEHLAACVNIIPGIESVYRWEGEIQSDSEYLLLCKTDAQCWPEFVDWVTANHSYTVPEIIQIPIIEGSSPYLGWLASCLEK